jgi:hypothetical protein
MAMVASSRRADEIGQLQEPLRPIARPALGCTLRMSIVRLDRRDVRRPRARETA